MIGRLLTFLNQTAVALVEGESVFMVWFAFDTNSLLRQLL